MKVNLIDSGIVGQVQKIYLYVFYNTNFILNIVALTSLSTPLFLTIFLQKELFLVFNSTMYLFIITTFLYNIVYISNDLFDYRKDKENKTYKFSVFSKMDLNPFLYSILYIGFLWSIIYIYSNIFIGSINILILYSSLLFFISIIHSKIKKLKIITLFIERFLRLVIPFYILSLFIENIYIDEYFKFVLIFFPLIIDSSYRRYIKSKLNISEKNRFFIYLFYFLILMILNQSNLFLRIDLMFKYLAFLCSFQFFIYISSNSFKFKFLTNMYNKDIDEKNRFLIEFIILVPIIIYLYYNANFRL
jgi:hypothetical protein